jgi:hypothetical protein
MKELYDDLHGACEVMSRELGDMIDKIEQGGKVTGADVDMVDKLTHSIKSIKTTMAMMDAEEGGSYDDGYRRSYNRGAYARRRDSMGRYTRRAYDDGDDMRMR